MRGKEIALASAAFLGTPFAITALFRLGVGPGPVPFALLLVVALASWLRGYRAPAVGIALGTIAWAVVLASILNAMGTGARFSLQDPRADSRSDRWSTSQSRDR